MKHAKLSFAVCAMLALGACSSTPTRDAGIDSGPLEGLQAGLWVDGNGCDHWIIDDGFEGYMSPRLDLDGKPICRDGAVPWSTVFFERRLIGAKAS